jgi:hypothetical protein
MAQRKENQISTEYRLLKSVLASDLFDGRLEKFGVQEHFKIEADDSATSRGSAAPRARCDACRACPFCISDGPQNFAGARFGIYLLRQLTKPASSNRRTVARHRRLAEMLDEEADSWKRASFREPQEKKFAGLNRFVRRRQTSSRIRLIRDADSPDIALDDIPNRVRESVDFQCVRCAAGASHALKEVGWRPRCGGPSSTRLGTSPHMVSEYRGPLPEFINSPASQAAFKTASEAYHALRAKTDHTQPISWRTSGWTAHHVCVDGKKYLLEITRPLGRGGYRWSIHAWRDKWCEIEWGPSATLPRAKSEAIHRLHQLAVAAVMTRGAV